MKVHQVALKSLSNIKIPKIIHQTAPSKKEDWHPAWNQCHESWHVNFLPNEFQHILWTDEDVDEFIKMEFPEYYTAYSNIPIHIVKIDILRLFILYYYGGIYSDMDMFCYKNFYNDLVGDLFLLESKKRSGGHEVFQNSLMASTAKNSFWIDCIEEAIKRVELFGSYSYSPGIEFERRVRLTAGPLLISQVSLYEKYENKILGLPEDLYNSVSELSLSNVIVRNMQTGMWGNESRNHLMSIKNYFFETMTMEEFLIQDYKTKHNINLNSIDYHKYRK